jgi:hypothetical protein
MFSFAKAKALLEDYAAKDARAKLVVLAEMTPAIALTIETSESIGSFRVWENALVDFEVFDIGLDSFIANEAMIQIDDDSIHLELSRFLAIAGMDYAIKAGDPD